MSLRPIFVVGILSLLLSTVKADGANMNFVSILHDTQISNNLSDLNFDQLLTSTTGQLAFVTITANQNSGNAKWIVSKYVDIKDPKTGFVSHIAQQSTLSDDEYSGNYSAYDVFTGKPLVHSNKYEWVEPHLQNFNAYYIPSAIYLEQNLHSNHDMHFMYDGTMICRIDAAIAGSGMFSSDYLVPPAWRSDLPEALRYHQNHHGIFSQNKSKGNYTALLKLLDSTNPFLSIDAARTLLESHLVRTDVVVFHFAKADFYKQAVLTILLLKNASPESQPALIDKLGNLIKKSESADELKGIALGALATENYTLLKQINQRVPLIQINTPTVEYVKDLVKAANIPCYDIMVPKN